MGLIYRQYNVTSEYHMVMVLGISKLYCHQSEEELVHIIDQFWIENETFWYGMALFQISCIWKISSIKDGKSYLWHNLYKNPFTKVLRQVGCQVTSEILGIGTYEKLLKVIGRTTSKYNVVKGHVCRVTHPIIRTYYIAHKICIKFSSREQDVSTTVPTWWLTWVSIILCIMIGSLTTSVYSMTGSRIGSQTP